MVSLQAVPAIRILVSLLVLATFASFGAQEVVAQEGDPDRPVVAGVVPTPAAVDMYLKIDGIEGESKDADHDKWIDVLSIDWGASGDPAAPVAGERPVRAANPRARRRGGSTLSDITINKGWDAASPKLLEACARGEHIPKVDVYLSRADGQYLKYELKNVMVTSYSMSGGGEGAVPTESVTLNFAEVEFTYSETDETKKDKPVEIAPARADG